MHICYLYLPMQHQKCPRRNKQYCDTCIIYFHGYEFSWWRENLHFCGYNELNFTDFVILYTCTSVTCIYVDLCFLSLFQPQNSWKTSKRVFHKIPWFQSICALIKRKDVNDNKRSSKKKSKSCSHKNDNHVNISAWLFCMYFVGREALPTWDKQIQSLCFQVNNIIEKISATEPAWMLKTMEAQIHQP